MGLAASSSSRADDPNVAAREYDEQWYIVLELAEGSGVGVLRRGIRL